MKVIKTDNYARETIADELVKENLTELEANILVEELNEKRYSVDWYVAVDDHYRLWRGMGDLV